MKGAIMIEKRCSVNIKNELFISIRCNRCKGETNIPITTTKEVEKCGVCGEYLGAPFIAYINNLRKREMIDTENFDISLVSIENE